MDILVIGTGMYASGRGTEGFGTIMPSIVEWKRNGGDLNSIHMVETNKKRSLEAFYKVEKLRQPSTSIIIRKRNLESLK